IAASRATPAPVEPPPTTRTSVSSVGTATGRSIAAARDWPRMGTVPKPVARALAFPRTAPFGDSPSDSEGAAPTSGPGPGTVPEPGLSLKRVGRSSAFLGTTPFGDSPSDSEGPAPARGAGPFRQIACQSSQSKVRVTAF